MSRIFRNATPTAAILLMTSVGTALVHAQTAAPESDVIGVGGFSHIVSSLERSVAFYRDVLSLEMPNPLPAFGSPPWIMSMGNTPGAQSRAARLHIPGSALGVELIDYKDIERTPVHPRFQDPGAASLILTVRDIDALMAKLNEAHAHINSKGGQSVTIAGPNGSRGRVLFVQDPDGFFVEISQRDPAPQNTAPAGSNIIGGAFEIIVANLDQTLHIYRDVLGFQTQAPTAFDGTKLMMDTAGTPGAQFRRSSATIPGTSVLMAFMEFKDIDRKPLHTRIPDPGTPILQLRVRDIHAAVEALKGAGVEVISKNGEPVINGEARFCMMRDPNNLFLELFQTPPRAQ
ncbi:MAG: VOC family protein [Bryobacterales bacterium]|nr:VOC family protein [Bryobacterales bacterium]